MEQREIVFICRDLLFTSKVTGTGKLLGLPVTVCPGVAAVAARFTAAPGVAGVIIDLGGITNLEELTELRSRFPAPVRMVAFGSHVDTAQLEAASAAGCDMVLPRSAFTRDLPDIMRLFAPSSLTNAGLSANTTT